MARRGKKYRTAVDKVEKREKYTVDDAVGLVKDMAFAKFDESVELAFKLGVNPKHADQMVRGAVSLPHGTGKTVRVVVFAKGEKEKEAQDAGADFVGAEDLVEKIQKENWLDFDAAVATPDMMAHVGKIGRLLGPRGLMPNPKVGTVTFDVGKTVSELKAGRVEFRTEKAGVVHMPVGKISFDADKLKENVMKAIDTIVKLRPQTAKGTYMQSLYISSTMGPGVEIDTAAAQAQLKR